MPRVPMSFQPPLSGARAGTARTVGHSGIDIPFGKSITVRGATFQLVIDSAGMQRLLRDKAGRYATGRRVMYDILRQNVIPMFQELHADAFDTAIGRGKGYRPGTGRVGYRRGGNYARQRPSQLLATALRTDPNLWVQMAGASGVRIKADALDRSPLSRGSARLAEYWRIQDEGSAAFVGRQVAISGAGGKDRAPAPGYQALRDISRRRRRKGPGKGQRGARVGRISNPIQGYDIFGSMLDEVVRAVGGSGLVTSVVERELILRGVLEGDAGRLRVLGTAQVRGLDAAREIFRRRADGGYRWTIPV